ncbi:hypothetical protein I350_03275 [Cryptococcus amylolentus CBS 6273]|uniref:Transmembrane protein n=1 Tax=Cryptococcus amylolentus CBS 6273 TaxID=1296118 RepID=A0A1E3K4E2_9TREE|nr:hypothetical protein I350_03275 [Cryptococcus amylolentus CBS 6273]
MAPEHGAAAHQQPLPGNDKRTSRVTQPTATTRSLPTPSQQRMAEMEESDYAMCCSHLAVPVAILLNLFQPMMFYAFNAHSLLTAVPTCTSIREEDDSYIFKVQGRSDMMRGDEAVPFNIRCFCDTDTLRQPNFTFLHIDNLPSGLFPLDPPSPASYSAVMHLQIQVSIWLMAALVMSRLIHDRPNRQNVLLHLFRFGFFLITLRELVQLWYFPSSSTVTEFKGLLVKNWREISKGSMTFHEGILVTHQTFITTALATWVPLLLLIADIVCTAYSWVENLVERWSNKDATFYQIAGDKREHV